MRHELRAELLEVGRLLVCMTEVVRPAMAQATEALLSVDRRTCELVLARDVEIGCLRRRVRARVYDTLARQAPVAADLRLLITGIHVAADLARMGDLAAHVAKTGLRRYPVAAVPPQLTEVVAAMGAVAEQMAGKAGLALSTHNAMVAAELNCDDDAMDGLQRRLFSIVLHKDWPHGAKAAVDGALLGRFYERYADHAVNAGRQVVYLATGHLSRPSGGK